MLIIIGLIITLSVPKVWLNPTLEESEFVDLVEDIDVSREKRQSHIFDLIHQAIENYANCAHEHLAPLKALANYKRYETLIYPEDSSANNEKLLGASHQPQKGNIKCTKVNLCSIENQPQIVSGLNTNEPAILGKSYYPQTPNFKKNGGFARFPIYGSNRLALKSPFNNNPSHRKSSSYKNNNKLTFSALNQAFLSKLFNIPETSTKKTTDEILGSEFWTAKSSNNLKSCTCNKSSTEKPPDIIEIKDSQIEIEQTTEKMSEISSEPEPLLGSEINIITKPEKIKSCSCLEKTTPKSDKTSDLSSLNNTISNPEITPTPNIFLNKKSKNNKVAEPILGSQLHPNKTEIQNITNPEIKSTIPNSSAVLASSFDITESSNSNQNCTCSMLSIENVPHLNKKDPLSNQNLNLLVLQLDFKARNESKEKLKKILKDLKALKSAMKLRNKVNNQTDTSTTTSKTLASTTEKPESESRTTVSTTTTKASTKSDPILGADNPHVEVKSTFVDLNENDNKNLNTDRNKTDAQQILKSSNLNITSEHSKDQNVKSNNDTLFPPKSLEISHTSNENRNDSSLALTAIKELSTNITKDNDITAVKSSKPLNLNITNSEDLERITDEVNALVTYMTNQTILENSHKNLSDIGDHKITNITIIKKTILTTSNQTLKDHNLNITDPKINIEKIMANLNNSKSSDKAQKNVNSTITISISSNGSFKKIEVENDSDKSSNKNVEINEKKMNLSSPKVRSIDMRGISTRYRNYLKTSRKKDLYTEPILSEIYSQPSKLKPKAPLSIFWHTIEKKPTKSPEIVTQNWEAFQSNDFEDYDYDSREDQENFSSSLEDCGDYDDLTEELKDKEINENKQQKKLCKRNVLIT